MHSGGSQARWKEWPADHWRAVAHHLLALDYTVYVSGGAADIDRNRSFLASMNNPRLSLSPSRGLDELVDLLRGATLLISVDTGIAHMAAAASVQTLVLHGPTSPARWGALGPSAHHLKDEQMPWINLGFESIADARRVALDVGDVVAAADQILGVRNKPITHGQPA